MKVLKFFFLLILLNLCFLISAEEIEENVVTTESQNNNGIIFSTNNILLDIGEYQGGVGWKFVFPDFAIKASLGGEYHAGTETLDLSGYTSVEFPLLIGPVVPYWGSSLKASYKLEQITTNDDWNRNADIAGYIGAFLGVEYFLLEHLSFFAEYELSLGLTRSVQSQNVGGEITETASTDWQIVTALGNNAMIGVVLYIQPALKLSDDKMNENK